MAHAEGSVFIMEIIDFALFMTVNGATCCIQMFFPVTCFYVVIRPLCAVLSDPRHFQIP